MMRTVLFATVFQGLAVMAGIVLLRIAVPGSWWIGTFLQRVTDPVFRLVAAVTPAVWPVRLHGVLAILWLLILRVAFYLGAGATGLLPPVTA